MNKNQPSDNFSLNKIFSEILETENKVIEKRKEKSLSQAKLKAKQQELFEIILENNDFVKQIDELNCKLIEVNWKLKENELQLEERLNHEKYLDCIIEEKQIEKHELRCVTKNKLKKQFSDITNFGSQYKFQDLHNRLEIREANLRRMNDLTKSILDLDSLPSTISTSLSQISSKIQDSFDPCNKTENMVDLNLLTDIFDDEDDMF